MSAENPCLSVRCRAFTAAFATAGALALAACHHAPPPPSNATPEQAVATSLRLAATGDFDGLMKNRLPPANYTQWRSEWNQARAHAEPATAARQRQFAQIMQMLTGPDAEVKLAKRLQPEFAKLHGGKNPSLPIFTGILRAAGMAMITDSPQLGASQKLLARQALGALIGWAKTTDFNDSKKAEKAIHLVCSTARQLHVQTLAQWRALDYTRTMRDYGIIWNGLEDVLNLYGLDLANNLISAKISTVTNDGSHATVKLDMTLAGQPLTGEWPMVKQAGHWYDAGVLSAWQKEHPARAATAIEPVASGTALPAASATSAVKPTLTPPSTKPPATSASTAPTGSVHG